MASLSSNISNRSNSVITAAVAGNERTRRLRACIAEKISPYLNNYAALGGASSFNPSEGIGIPPPLEMTGAKESAVLATRQDPDAIFTIENFNTNQNDTVLIIGQVCFKFFNKDCDNLLSRINRSRVYIMGGTTPSDFNISMEGVEMLGNGCEIISVATSECPKYNSRTMGLLISKYDKVASDIHNIAVGAFLTSRTATNDGAFYRQFGLANMAKDQEGSGKSVMNFEKSCDKGKTSNKFPQEIKNKMDDIIEHCNTNPNPV